jgi:hypothetical protein
MFVMFGYLVVTFLVIGGMRAVDVAEKGTRYAVVLIVETFENSRSCPVTSSQEGLIQSLITTTVMVYLPIMPLHPSINVPIRHIMRLLVNQHEHLRPILVKVILIHSG